MVNQGSSGHLLELVSFTYSWSDKGRGTQRSDRERNGRERGINLNAEGARRKGTAWHKHAISIRLAPLRRTGVGTEAHWEQTVMLIWLTLHGHADMESMEV